MNASRQQPLNEVAGETLTDGCHDFSLHVFGEAALGPGHGVAILELHSGKGARTPNSAE